MDYSERIHNRLAAHPGKVRTDAAAIAGEADCEIAALRFALDEVGKEAARYRWLRDGALTNKAATVAMWEANSCEELDAMIDAAMAGRG